MGNLDIYYKCSGYCLERGWHKAMGMLEFYQFFITSIIHTDNSDIILFKTTEKQVTELLLEFEIHKETLHSAK